MSKPGEAQDDAPVTPSSPAFDFVIPGATITIRNGDELMPIDQALAIVFHIAAASPGCKVRFYVEVME